MDELSTIAQNIINPAQRLIGAAHPTTIETLSKLLREMNSYYSNKIEGHHTHPIHIARGLKKDFSTQPVVAQLQRLTIVHIDAEDEIESWIRRRIDFSPFSVEGIRRIHEALYSKLSVVDRTIEDGRIVLPGIWRDVDVQVGHHYPPPHASVSTPDH